MLYNLFCTVHSTEAHLNNTHFVESLSLITLIAIDTVPDDADSRLRYRRKYSILSWNFSILQVERSGIYYGVKRGM